MQIFQTTIKHYRLLGVYVPEALEKNTRINITLILAYFFLCQFFLTTTTFLFDGAKTFGDYTDAFYWGCTSLTTITLLAIIIWKKEKLFSIFNSFQKTIENRKSESHRMNF